MSNHFNVFGHDGNAGTATFTPSCSGIVPRQAHNERIELMNYKILSRLSLMTLVVALVATLATPTFAIERLAGEQVPPVSLQVASGEALSSPQVTYVYRGIRPDDLGGRDPLLNPHRGLRLELFFNADQAPPSVADLVAQAQANHPDGYEMTGNKVAQVYFYLNAYIGQHISEAAKTNMQQVFTQLKDLGYTVVLRFAYDREFKEFKYTLDDIEMHLGDLRPLLLSNAGLITNWEAGFVGQWGEWGPSQFVNQAGTEIRDDPAQVNRLMESIAATAPDGVPITMRYPWHRDMITSQQIEDKIGFYNDNFTGGSTSQFDFYTPDNPAGDSNKVWWAQVVAASPHVMVDGETPYRICRSNTVYDVTQCNPETGETLKMPLDGLAAAKRLQTMHYTTLSEIHENSKFARLADYYLYSFPYWKDKQTLNLKAVKDAGLPFDPAYFSKATGEPFDRSVYEYIRDHLGYRLRLTSATFGGNAGSTLPVTLNIVNDGFSAPHSERTPYLVLLDGDGDRVKEQALPADWTTWQGLGSSETAAEPRTQPIYTVEGALDLTGLAAGTYSLGLWLPDSHDGNMHDGVISQPDLKSDAKYAVRLANGDITWRNGVNVIATVTVQNDTTAPSANPSITAGIAGANGWYTSDVTVSWKWNDGGSGIDAAHCTTSSTSSGEGSIILTATCEDNAGNTGNASYTAQVDKTAPALNPTVSPNQIVLNGSATASANASDATSGLATQSCGVVTTSSVGSKTVSCTATDSAGNSASQSISYRVAYDFMGFGAPIDNNGVLNVAKAGQTIPLKWRLLDAAGNPVTTLSSVTVRVQDLNCSAGSTTDQIEEYASGSSGLQNLGAGYYQFNWKTPTTYAPSCKTMHLDLGEGATRTALFQFTK
jgi:hypothetical protein